MKDHKDIFKSVKRTELLHFIYFVLNPKEGRKLVLSTLFFIAGLLTFLYKYFTASDASIGQTVLYIFSISSLLFSFSNLYMHIFKNENLVIEANPNADKLILNTKLSEQAPGDPPETFVRDKDLDEWLRSQPELIMNNKESYRKNILEHLQANSAVFEKLIRTNFILSKKRNRQFSNDKNICLASDISKNMQDVNFYIGSYFENFCTNEFFAKLIRTTGAAPKLIATGLDSTPATAEVINPLAISNLSNQIGISTLAISSDGYIRLWKQGDKNQQSRGKITATGSGSLDDDDLDVSSTLLRTVCNGMERELREESSEMGLEFSSDPVIETRVTGYFRWVRRGGKPEFVGVTRLNIPIDDLKANFSEVEAHEYLKTRIPARNWQELSEGIGSLLESNSQYAVSTLIALKCLLEIAEEKPKSWEKFLFA